MNTRLQQTTATQDCNRRCICCIKMQGNAQCAHLATPYCYGVASSSRLLQSIGLFCKRALQKRLYSAQDNARCAHLAMRDIAMTDARWCTTAGFRCLCFGTSLYGDSAAACSGGSGAGERETRDGGRGCERMTSLERAQGWGMGSLR